MPFRDTLRVGARHAWRFGKKPLMIIIGLFILMMASLFILPPIGTRVPQQQATHTQTNAPPTAQPPATHTPQTTSSWDSFGESVVAWKNDALHWTPKEWLVFAAFALAFIWAVHAFAPRHHLAWAATLVAIGIAIWLSPPLTSSSFNANSWEGSAVELFTNLSRAIVALDPLYKLILCGILALLLILPFVYFAYETKDYPLVSWGLFGLGLVAPAILVWWVVYHGPGAALADAGFSSCTGVPFPHHYGTQATAVTDGSCRPEFWHKGHCILAGPEPTKMVRYCDVDGRKSATKQPNHATGAIRYVATADSPFDDAMRLVPY